MRRLNFLKAFFEEWVLELERNATIYFLRLERKAYFSVERIPRKFVASASEVEIMIRH
jgi:hypothetical protein